MVDKAVSYSEVAELCSSETGVEQLKDYIKQVADVINEYTLDFLNDARFTIEEYQTIQKRLTGCVMYLQPIYSYAETIKRNSKLARFMDIKTQYVPESPKDKFVATSAENEAELSVASFREVRNMVEGYLKSAEAGIFTCKDRISEKKMEINNAGE